MTEQQYRILLVEDDECIRKLTRMHLKMNSFDEVYSVGDAESAWILAHKIIPDIILLDIMLPGVDGLTLLKKFRRTEMFQNVPVIVITAKGEEEDVVAGLEAGADDYISKPFSTNVLIARIRVQLRRLQQSVNQAVTVLHGLEIDSESRVVKLNGEKISMTADEFDTINLLVKNPERVYTRRQIIDNVKGGDYPVTDRVVDIRMMKLRRKLGSWAEHLITVRGVGYKITGF